MIEGPEVVIIGGGISGLSVAWLLRRQGVDALLLEKSESCGGAMKTVRKDGWLIEQGPNSVLETTPLFTMMFEGLGIAGERIYANPLASKRYIIRNGTPLALPTSITEFFTTDLWSVAGKLRLLKEPFVGRAEKNESIAEFVERRLGREFLDYAINPFVAGVYAGNPEDLSVRAAFPKLYALEENYGGLVKGMIRERKERGAHLERSKDRARLFSFRQGMEVFPAALARAMGGGIRNRCEITDVRYGTEGEYEIHNVHEGESTVVQAPAVVLATPAHPAARIVKGVSPAVSSRLEAVFYPPVGEVFFGFRQDQIGRDLDGFGFLVPEKERRRILGTIWSSSLFEGRAPDGHVALTTFVGGARQPGLMDLDDDRLRMLVLEELHSLLNIAGEPVFTSITRWKKAIPQYNLGYEATLKAIDDCEAANPGLFFCSNFKGGIAVGDCIVNSEKTATRILEHLSRIRRHTGKTIVGADC